MPTRSRALSVYSTRSDWCELAQMLAGPTPLVFAPLAWQRDSEIPVCEGLEELAPFVDVTTEPPEALQFAACPAWVAMRARAATDAEGGVRWRLDLGQVSAGVILTLPRHNTVTGVLCEGRIEPHDRFELSQQVFDLFRAALESRFARQDDAYWGSQALAMGPAAAHRLPGSNAGF